MDRSDKSELTTKDKGQSGVKGSGASYRTIIIPTQPGQGGVRPGKVGILKVPSSRASSTTASSTPASQPTTSI